VEREREMKGVGRVESCHPRAYCFTSKVFVCLKARFIIDDRKEHCTQVSGVGDDIEAMTFENLTSCFSVISFKQPRHFCYNAVSFPLLFPSKLLSSPVRGGTLVNNNQIY